MDCWAPVYIDEFTGWGESIFSSICRQKIALNVNYHFIQHTIGLETQFKTLVFDISNVNEAIRSFR